MLIFASTNSHNIEYMKKLLTMIAFACMAWAMPAQAQCDFGVKAGLNLSNFSINGNEVLAAENKTGFFAGITAKLTLPIVGLGVDGSVLYDQREAKIKGTNAEIKQQSIQIPINLRYGVGIGDVANIFAYAGPQFGFNLGNNDDSFNDKVNNAFDWRFKDSGLSGNVGLGVTLLKHLQATVNYNFAIGKTGDFDNVGSAIESATNKTIKAKANAWQVAVAYYF